jgi:hypothetical protein
MAGHVLGGTPDVGAAISPKAMVGQNAAAACREETKPENMVMTPVFRCGTAAIFSVI